MKKLIILLLVVTVAGAGLAGCATTDRGQTQQEGAGAGAVGGALLGALIGGLAGGDASSALIGAGIGAAVGGLAGYAYGTHVADKKEEYAKQEDWLDACIASLQQTNAETLAYNNQLEADIKDYEAESNKLTAEYNDKKVKKSALTAEKEKIDATLAEANEKLDKAKWELENQEELLAEVKEDPNQDAYAKTLDAEIAKLKKQVAELEANTQELADMSSRMAV